MCVWVHLKFFCNTHQIWLHSRFDCILIFFPIILTCFSTVVSWTTVCVGYIHQFLLYSVAFLSIWLTHLLVLLLDSVQLMSGDVRVWIIPKVYKTLACIFQEWMLFHLPAHLWVSVMMATVLLSKFLYYRRNGIIL